MQEEAKKLAEYTGYRMVSVVGGQSIEEQGYKLRKGCEIILATPGRLKDCLDKAYAVLNQCNYIVLDEADRMIDLGFEPQVTCLLGLMRFCLFFPLFFFFSFSPRLPPRLSYFCVAYAEFCPPHIIIVMHLLSCAAICLKRHFFFLSGTLHMHHPTALQQQQ